MLKTKRASLIIVCLIFSLVFSSTGCKNNGAPARPKLVVLIVVDQFRYDFLERYDSVFGTGGFRRLMNDGAFFTNANYIHMPTYTAPGHAAIATGSVPAQNGIVGNNYYDRESRTDKVMVSDDAAKLVTSYGTQSYTKATKPASPRILIGTTIGDQMRMSSNYRSKVIAMSLKDRAAVLPGGREANGAFWFDASSGTFVSSDYYFKDMPGWADKFNAAHKPDTYFGKVWDRSLDSSAYAGTQGVTTDVKGSPLGRHFPYTINGGTDKPGEEYYRAFQYTPYASDVLADFAKAAIDGESLGADDFPDLLAISFSTTDLVGHAYGPDSEEVEEIYIQLDRTLANLLDYIDQKVGLSNTVIAMTGDHGVCPVPSWLSLKQFDAGTVDPARCKDAVNQALTARFGAPQDGSPWVLDLVNDQLYLDRKVMAAQKADPAEAERVAGEAALGLRRASGLYSQETWAATVPEDAGRSVTGLAGYYTRTQILDGRLPPGWIPQHVLNGFNPARSGDVWLITKPFYFFGGEGEIATTHGSAYDYDTHVPVIFFGPGIRANRYSTECSPADIAPTLSSILGIEPPSNRVGHVLEEAIKSDKSE